jgi:lipopolysaccharide/colanic/teichoic acid biosynthesis glycosyltransferase
VAVQEVPSADAKTTDQEDMARAAGHAAAVGAAETAAASSPPRRRLRPLGHMVPATRDLGSTWCGFLAVSGAVIAFALLAPVHVAGAPAIVAAAAGLGCAATLLHALVALCPPGLRGGSPRRPVRAAVIGPVASLTALRAELRHADVDVVELVGAIRPGEDLDPPQSLPELGRLSAIGEIVDEQRIDLLLVASGVSAPSVVDAVLRACEGRSVRLCRLSSFYEEVFGHVPLTEIDAAWFEYVLHPRFRPRRSQRVLDLVAGAVIAVAFLPVLAVVAVLIRLDGGPVLFRQLRIGQDGRPFVLYKLRTMRWEDGGGSPCWAASDDPRNTRVGRILRRTHLDELPQLFNVLRGEMTMVGPRPEQPEIAALLEQSVPYWRARYRYKPGLTGWAQIHCGYGGSDDGSAWKLAHDLYYLRRQSPMLDVAILLQTASTLLSPQHLEPPATPYVLQRPLPGGKELGIAAAPVHSD